MTSNQIAYMANRETAQHNRATEAHWASQLAEEIRSNMATERETQRANLAREAHNINALNETIRSNQAREGETQRHNMVVEQQGFLNLAETQRHNVASESLQDYANQTSRLLQQSQSALHAAQMNAAYQQASYYDAQAAQVRTNTQIAADVHANSMNPNIANPVTVYDWQAYATAAQGQASGASAANQLSQSELNDVRADAERGSINYMRYNAYDADTIFPGAFGSYLIDSFLH